MATVHLVFAKLKPTQFFTMTFCKQKIHTNLLLPMIRTAILFHQDRAFHRIQRHRRNYRCSFVVRFQTTN